MPPKAMKGESSTFSLLTAWMQPKPKTEPPNTEHDKTEHDKTEHSTTPSPTEVADSSQGSEKPEKDDTPAEVVDCTAFDYETWFMQRGASRTDGKDDGSDDDFDDGLATDEAAAIAELMAQAAAQNVTMQVLVTNKRPRTEPESTEPAAPEEAD